MQESVCLEKRKIKTSMQWNGRDSRGGKTTVRVEGGWVAWVIHWGETGMENCYQEILFLKQIVLRLEWGIRTWQLQVVSTVLHRMWLYKAPGALPWDRPHGTDAPTYPHLAVLLQHLVNSPSGCNQRPNGRTAVLIRLFTFPALTLEITQRKQQD